MKLHRIRLKLKSALLTPLQSDTIFGHFCWAIVNRHGERRLADFLSSDVPYVIFSNGFSEEMLPRPIIPPMSIEEREKIKHSIGNRLNSIEKFRKLKNRNPDFESEKILKKLKKRQFILKSTAKALQQGLSEMNLVEKILDDHFNDLLTEDPNAPVQQSIFHYERERNIISRITGATLQEGGLFTVSETRYRNKLFDVYMSISDESPINFDEINLLLRDVFETSGYGADISVGAGHFDILDISEENVQVPQNVAGEYRVMSLSNFVPNDENIEFDSLNYSLLSKFGKLGDRYATSGKPFKKPIVMMQAGSTFRINKVKNSYGKLLRGVHSDTKIVQNAAAIPLYFKEVRTDE